MPGMMPGSSGMGSRGLGGKEERTEGGTESILQFRRRLKQCLDAVRRGLNGPALADTPRAAVRAIVQPGTPDCIFVDEILKLVQEQIRTLDKQDADYDDLAKEIRKTRGDLTKLLDGGPAAAAAAAAAAPAKGARAASEKK